MTKPFIRNGDFLRSVVYVAMYFVPLAGNTGSGSFNDIFMHTRLHKVSTDSLPSWSAARMSHFMDHFKDLSSQWKRKTSQYRDVLSLSPRLRLRSFSEMLCDLTNCCNSWSVLCSLARSSVVTLTGRLITSTLDRISAIVLSITRNMDDARCELANKIKLALLTRRCFISSLIKGKGQRFMISFND